MDLTNRLQETKKWEGENENKRQLGGWMERKKTYTKRLNTGKVEYLGYLVGFMVLDVVVCQCVSIQIACAEHFKLKIVDNTFVM